MLNLSAGFMVGAIFFHMLPEAIEIGGKNSSIWILSGFLFLYVLERFMTIHACEEEECSVHEIGHMAFLGMSIHTVTDGFALGAAVLYSPVLGFSVFIAIIAHKFPNAFALSTILSHSGYSIRKILMMMFAFAMLVPIGAVLFICLSRVYTKLPVEGFFVAFSCGSFLHIALSDVIPEMHKVGRNRYYNTLLFLGGAALMALLSIYAGHD